jgi:glycerophosphoryl diester phosphodiesterase
MAYPWRGVWSANTIYPSGSLVSFRGAIFLATSTTTAGQSPPAAPWSVVVSQEGQGPSASSALPAYTIAQMRAQAAGWYVAHRGSGAEFPEHTLVGYDVSTELMRTNGYVPAIEVSVVAAADKTLFCMHDPDFDKSTNSTGAATTRPWSEIAALVRSEETDYLGPGWPGQRLVTLREVLDRFIHNTVIFVEAKSNAAVQPLQRMLLEDYPQARQNVVVKMMYNNSLLSWARTNGFTTWGYLAGDGLTNDSELNTYDSVVDMWGIPAVTTDARIAEIVARGKDTMVWEVHRREQARHLSQDLGVKGLMCSRIAYVTRSTNTEFTYKMLAADNFATKVMMPGMLEGDPTIPTSEASRATRLKFDASDGSVYFPSLSSAHTVCLGGLNEVPAPSSYNVLWSMKWPVIPPVSTQVSGVAVCRPDDTQYIFTGSTNTVGGYHCLVRANGEMLINRHDPGTAGSTAVANGTPPTTSGFQPPVADTYMTFRIEVRPTSLTFVRTDISPEFSITSSAAAAQTYRGPYMHLVSGNVTQNSSTPHWRNVSMPTV